MQRPACCPKPRRRGQIVKLTGEPTTINPPSTPCANELKGKTIGIQSGTVYTKFIDDDFKDVATIRDYKTSPEHDLDLASGRIDVAFDDVTYYARQSTRQRTSRSSMAGPKIGGPIWGPGEGLAFRKPDADLKAKFDRRSAPRSPTARSRNSPRSGSRSTSRLDSR